VESGQIRCRVRHRICLILRLDIVASLTARRSR
jgi:hypothetical protein